MKTSQMFPSKYLKAADVEGKVFNLTIARVVMEDIGGENNEHKPVVYFQEARKGLVLNRTNCNTLEWLYGDDTDGWAGKPVEVFTEMTSYMGKPGLGVRLRGPAQQPASSPAVAKSEETMSRPLAPSETQAAPGVARDLDDAIPF